MCAWKLFYFGQTCRLGSLFREIRLSQLSFLEFSFEILEHGHLLVRVPWKTFLSSSRMIIIIKKVEIFAAFFFNCLSSGFTAGTFPVASVETQQLKTLFLEVKGTWKWKAWNYLIIANWSHCALCLLESVEMTPATSINQTWSPSLQLHLK